SWSWRAGPLPAKAAAPAGFGPVPFADADLHGPVGDARTYHRSAEPAGLRDRPGGREPAVAPPGDAEAGGVCDTISRWGIEVGQDVGPFVLAHGVGHHGGECLAVAPGCRGGWGGTPRSQQRPATGPMTTRTP